MKNYYLPASIGSLIVGLVFLTVGDGTRNGATTTGLQHIVLTYFHGITWILLAALFMFKYTSYSNADYVGYAALIMYIVFLVSLFLGK